MTHISTSFETYKERVKEILDSYLQNVGDEWNDEWEQEYASGENPPLSFLYGKMTYSGLSEIIQEAFDTVGVQATEEEIDDFISEFYESFIPVGVENFYDDSMESLFHYSAPNVNIKKFIRTQKVDHLLSEE